MVLILYDNIYILIERFGLLKAGETVSYLDRSFYKEFLYCFLLTFHNHRNACAFYLHNCIFTLLLEKNSFLILPDFWSAICFFFIKVNGDGHNIQLEEEQLLR